MISKKIFISVCTYKPAPLVKTNYLIPIQVGKATASWEIENAVGDDTGNNISHKNQSWNELTGLYWMHHNVDAEYYGMMHYRRILSFNDQTKRGFTFETITDREYQKFGWDDPLIENVCGYYDIITAPDRPIYLPGMPDVLMTAADFYACQHHAKDMALVEKIVRERSPHIYPYLVQVLTGRSIFFSNIAIMRKPFFHEYCDWLFDVLEEAERRIDISGYDKYQKRIWGFLAEYLAYAYVAYAKSVHSARQTTLPMAMGKHQRPLISTDRVLQDMRATRNTPKPKKPDDEAHEIINVVLAIDDHYAPHAAVTMLSALQASSYPEKLHFFILSGGAGLSRQNSDRLSAIVTQQGCKITFITVDDAELRWLPLNRDYISIATYYRLIMHEVLPDAVKKVVYIDADTVVIEGLEKLWGIDLNGHPVAGAPDDAGVQQARRLRLDVNHCYFNAGVMVFDLVQFRAMNLKHEIQSIFRTYGLRIVSQDQDILNILFCNNTQKLPLRWNAGTRLFQANSFEPSYNAEEALDAAQNPAIIHFTDQKKPWHTRCRHPFSALYWDYRNETPWAEGKLKQIRRAIIRFLRKKTNRRERQIKKLIETKNAT